MLIIVLSWLLLLFSLALIVWVFFVKARGELIYWIRPAQTETQWAVGRTLAKDKTDEQAALLPELNSFLRTHERSTNTVFRQWDKQKETSFTGLVLPQPIAEESCLSSGYELRELPGQMVIRLSGKNRISEEKPVTALTHFAKKHDISFDADLPSRLSGQSFSLYQWPITKGELQLPLGSQLAERSFQWRDMLVFPIIFTLFSLGLLGTQNPILFAGGLFLLIFLSGACKFVFLHQRKDEAQEEHLQNY